MFVHTVLFWLKPDLTAAERAEFEAGLKSLAGIPSVRAIHVGRPASTDRPVVDRTYSYGVDVHFDDLAGHDAYQSHPLHTGFLAAHSSKWLRVVIYDFE